MKIYEGPLGRVDVVGAELYVGDLVAFARPRNSAAMLSLGYIEIYNTDSNFITIRHKDYVPKYSWDKETTRIKFEPYKFYKIDRVEPECYNL